MQNEKPIHVAPMLERKLFINNEWRAGSTGEQLTLVNPATEVSFGSAASASRDDVNAAVAAARTAFDSGPWPQLSIQERAAILLRFASELESDIDALTELVIMETGLPRADSKGGTLAMLAVLRYYASIADTVQLVETRVGRTGVTASIEKFPIGVVAQIVPWNSPIVMAAINLPSALLAGCTVVLKPSELTPLSAGYLADAALRAGLPAGVLNIVTGAAAASDALVRHPDVNKVAFTGSTPTGRKVAEAAAATLKHVALELGGKAAALILEDAPLQRIVDAMVHATIFNNGQMCLQPSRLIVPESRKEEIVDALVKEFAKIPVGDPLDPKTRLGPLINRKQYDNVIRLLKSALEEGGRFAIGGGRPEGLDTGYYIAPTIIVGVSPKALVAREEIFAPVLVVLTYRTEEEGLAMVNDTEYGLNDAVFSADTDRALRVARKMQSGNVSINNGQMIDVAIPFGGIKQSGYGRELGPEGLESYFETHTIFLNGENFARLR
jgi:aldehyde dehydrogenase (NAD+)